MTHFHLDLWTPDATVFKVKLVDFGANGVWGDGSGGWPGDARNAFTGAGLTPAQLEMQAYVRKLANWRKTATAVHHGKLMQYVPIDGVYVYFRYDDAQTVMVVMNSSRPCGSTAVTPVCSEPPTSDA